MKKIILLCFSFIFLYAQCQRDTQNEIVICKDKVLGKIAWQDDSSAKSTKKTWKEAKSYCASLSLAGFNNWRLPNIYELRSIVDYERYEPAINGAFENVVNKNYWSSSSYVFNPSDAWTVDFADGDDYWFGKSHTRYVRCVR